MTATTFERVRKVFVEQLGMDRDQVTRDARIYGELGADSLDVELFLGLEEEFGIEIPDDDAARILSTVDDVVRYIDDKVGK